MPPYVLGRASGWYGSTAKPAVAVARLFSPMNTTVCCPVSPKGTRKPALLNPPPWSLGSAATGVPLTELTSRSTRSPGTNPLPEKLIRCAALTAYGCTLIVGYRPSTRNGALAAEPLLRPTTNRLLVPTGATPTCTLTLLTDPPPSACRTVLGSPVTRPQYTPRSSLDANPEADRDTWSPGRAAAA